MQYQLFKDGRFYAIYASREAALKAANKLAGAISISRLTDARKKITLNNHKKGYRA